MSIAGSSGSSGSSAPVYKEFRGSYGTTTPVTGTPGYWQEIPSENGMPPSRTWVEGTTSGGDPSYEDSARLSRSAEGMINQKSVFSTPLEDAILNPKYGAQNPAESALISSLLDATAGRTATRGLSAPTQGAMTSAIAPTLVDMYQKNIQNMLGGYGADTQAKGVNLQALMELIGYAMPQVVGGNTSSESSSGWNICWVAREIYGENNVKWLYFRKWMFEKSPVWFFNLYRKYGERFAKFIRNKPSMKSLIRRWMDKRICMEVA